ncbi:MAG: YfcC family protein, partial [Bacteroidales bacterium]|nr:YfcC family protein [Bacteroidales bacterium]
MIKKIPHTFALIFYIIVFAAILTWIIPGGEFDKQIIEINHSTREVIVPDSYHRVERNPQSWQVFAAFFEGFVDKADIIVFIFMVGGAFMIVGKSRAIDAGIFAVLRLTGNLEKIRFLHFIGVDNLILSVIMLVFSVFGAVFGMSEETIPFVLIIVPLAISMGYDSITGVALVFVAAAMGFAGAVLNPFTIGIAQGIAGLPMFSGLSYRLFAWLVINVFGILYILIYANKIKKKPAKSLVFDDDVYWRKKEHATINHIDAKKTKSSVFVFFVVSIFLI